jgi:hypothetical protein
LDLSAETILTRVGCLFSGHDCAVAFWILLYFLALLSLSVESGTCESALDSALLPCLLSFLPFGGISIILFSFLEDTPNPNALEAGRITSAYTYTYAKRCGWRLSEFKEGLSISRSYHRAGYSVGILSRICRKTSSMHITIIAF